MKKIKFIIGNSFRFKSKFLKTNSICLYRFDAYTRTIQKLTVKGWIYYQSVKDVGDYSVMLQDVDSNEEEYSFCLFSNLEFLI